MRPRRFLRRPGPLGGAAIAVGVAVVVVIGILVGSALAPSHSAGRSGGVQSEGPAEVANPIAGRINHMVGTDLPPEIAGAEAAAREDFGENLAGEKVSDLLPLAPRRFAKPVSEYKAYAHGWVERTIVDAKALGRALEGGSRADAKAAWEKAWGDYMHLGADYGLFGQLEEELDGTAGGAEAATSNPDFVGFRRLEYGIWTGKPLGALASYDRRLITDLKHLRKALPGVEIEPLDYATRGHEIVEDAQRDLMNGMDVPWSHQGVLGTAAAVDSADEVFKTLKPLLSGRENTETEVEYWLERLQGYFAGLRHDGRYPTTNGMPTEERERMNGYVAGSLTALEMVPSTLETENYTAPEDITGKGK
jgi:hypothetical protein